MPVPERGGIQKGRNGEPVRTVLQPPGRRENEQPPEARHPLTVGEEVRMGRLEGKNPINWLTTIFMVLIHIGAIAALFFFSWTTSSSLPLFMCSQSTSASGCVTTAS